MDWILFLGIAFIVVILATLVVFLVRGIKQGFLKTVINFGISLGGLVASFFLAKPVLWIFDRFYKFSMTFFDKFMNAFAKIPLMNQFVNGSNLHSQIVLFENTDVVMSPWLKSFLLKIFNNTRLYAGETTTLATIGANALSYILMSILVALSLFATIKIVIDMVVLKIDKIKSTGKPLSKLGGAFFGLSNAVIFVFIGISIVSVLPFGADDITVSKAIEKTVVMQPVFNISQNITTNYYANNIDWMEQNKNFTHIDEALIATYFDKTTTDEDRYVVAINIIDTNRLTETVYDKWADLTVATNFKYIFANDSLWIFDNSNMFVMSAKVSQKDKAIEYHKQIDNGDETYTNYYAWLRQ